MVHDGHIYIYTMVNKLVDYNGNELVPNWSDTGHEGLKDHMSLITMISQLLLDGKSFSTCNK